MWLSMSLQGTACTLSCLECLHTCLARTGCRLRTGSKANTCRQGMPSRHLWMVPARTSPSGRCRTCVRPCWRRYRWCRSCRQGTGPQRPRSPRSSGRRWLQSCQLQCLARSSRLGSWCRQQCPWWQSPSRCLARSLRTGWLWQRTCQLRTGCMLKRQRLWRLCLMYMLCKMSALGSSVMCQSGMVCRCM